MSSLTVLNHEIHQTDGLYCLNDLHKASGGVEKHQPAFFLRNQETKDLIAELEQETKARSANLQNGQKYDVQILPSVVIKKIQGGNNKLVQGTYACKEIVYRYAMWISPKFALAVIRVFDAFVNGKLQPTQPQIDDEEKISETQAHQLQEAVKKRCKHNKEHYQTVWTAIKNRFQVTSYKNILIKDFDNALNLVWTIALPVAVIEPPQEQLLVNPNRIENIHKVAKLGMAKTRINYELFKMIDKALTDLDYATRELQKNNATHYSVFESVICQSY